MTSGSALKLFPKRELNHAIFDKMTQIRLAQILTVEMNPTTADRVPNTHLAIGTGAEFQDALPDTQTLKDPLAGPTQGRHPKVHLARGPLSHRGARFDQCDREPFARHGAGKRRSDHAAAHDSDIEGLL